MDWSNIAELEDKSLVKNRGNYRQEWFPGDHGSVGGGGNVLGLSSAACLWIWQGAEKQGLEFDLAAKEGVERQVNLQAPLNNTEPVEISMTGLVIGAARALRRVTPLNTKPSNTLAKRIKEVPGYIPKAPQARIVEE